MSTLLVYLHSYGLELSNYLDAWYDGTFYMSTAIQLIVLRRSGRGIAAHQTGNVDGSCEITAGTVLSPFLALW